AGESDTHDCRSDAGQRHSGKIRQPRACRSVVSISGETVAALHQLRAQFLPANRTSDFTDGDRDLDEVAPEALRARDILVREHLSRQRQSVEARKGRRRLEIENEDRKAPQQLPDDVIVVGYACGENVGLESAERWAHLAA